MGVLDLDNFNLGHFRPIQAAVILAGQRFIGRDKEQPVGMIEIDTELALAVAGHFMASGRWETGNLIEVFCRTQLQKALLQLAGTGGSKGFLDLPGGRTDFLKLLGAKEYLHVQLGQNNSHDMFIFSSHGTPPREERPAAELANHPVRRIDRPLQPSRRGIRAETGLQPA